MSLSPRRRPYTRLIKRTAMQITRQFTAEILGLITPSRNIDLSKMSATGDVNIGFIGLGAMGRGMAANLAKRVSGDSKVYVYDVVDGLMDDLHSEHPGTVRKSKSAKEVSEISVSLFPSSSSSNVAQGARSERPLI